MAMEERQGKDLHLAGRLRVTQRARLAEKENYEVDEGREVKMAG